VTTTWQPPIDKAISLTPDLIRYVRVNAGRPTAAQRALINVTHALGDVAEMQIPVEQGVLLTMLARLMSARTVVEVGTFTGYSTLALAEGVGADGRILTFDIADTWSGIAAHAWQEAGVSARIESVLGPAEESLAALPSDPFIDLVFIDADKVNYVTYWELLVPRVRPGGLLIADNVLYSGEAGSPKATGNGLAIREFNEHVLADDRVESVLLPVADGITLARKTTRKTGGETEK